MARPDTAQPRRMRTLVTGAGGFIGATLVNRLVELGTDVVAVARRPGRLEASAPGYRFVACDLRSAEQVLVAVQAAQPQVVFHLAAHPDAKENGRQVQEAIQHNIVGLANLLDAMMTLPAVSLVYGDSAKVYGNGGVPYRSDQALEPLSSYGVSKAAGWHLIDLYRRVHGLQATGLRPTLVYGPGQGFNLFTFLINAVASATDEIPLDGGSQTRDPLYIDDMVEALIAVSRNIRQLNGMNLPIGGNHEMSVEEIARTTVRLLGGKQRVVVRPGNVRPTETMRSWCDNREATALLGWSPRMSFEAGILETARHLLRTTPAILPARVMAPPPAAVSQGSP